MRLDDIIEGTITIEDPLFTATKTEIGQSLEVEFGQQLRKAIQAEVGAERNEAAIEAVRKQLSGAN